MAQQQNNNGAQKMGMDYIQKAAILLMSLETQSPGVASKIFAHIGEKRSKRLIRAITDMGKVDSSEVNTILDEFYDLAIDQKVVLGGRFLSQKILKESFGVQEQEEFFAERLGLFDFLSKVSDDVLFSFFQEEGDQLIALLFSYMEDEHVARFMTRFSAEKSTAITQLLLNIDVPNHSLLWKLHHGLEDKLILKRSRTEEVGEQESILKLSRALEIMEPSARENVLDLLRKSDQKAAESLQKLIFSFDDFDYLDIGYLKTILYEVDPLRTLALAMRNASTVFNERVMSNISDRVKLMLQEELEMLPETVATEDIQRARNEIVSLARRLEREGKVILKTQTQINGEKEG